VSIGHAPLAPADGGAGPGLGEAARVQLRVIGALMIREMQTRFGRHNIGYLWMFVEPMLLVTAISAIHALSDQALRNGLPIFLFYVTGYAPFFMFRAIVTRAAPALTSNMTLLYHRQVQLLDVMIARNMLEGMAVVTVLTVLVGVTSWVTGEMPASLTQMVSAMALMFLLSFGLAMVIAALCGMFDLLERFVHPMTYLALPFSGAFTALDWLPPGARDVLLMTPLAHLHEMMREGMFGPRMEYHYDLGFVLAWTAGLLLLGLASVRAARVRLIY
jgi:capsular polysaccharide transport system permease protein